jgi:hypothetical protein
MTCALLQQSALALAQQPVFDGYYSYETGSIVTYQVPTWAKLASAQLSANSFGHIGVTFMLTNPIPGQVPDKGLLEATFASQGHHYRVVIPIGSAKFYGSATVSSGQAAIVDSQLNVLDITSVSVVGGTVSASFNGNSFIGFSGKLASFRYLPASSSSSAGLNDGHTTVFALDPQLNDYNVILDYVPDGISPGSPPPLTLFADNGDEFPVLDNEFNLIRDLRLPLKWPPGATCPPIPPYSPPKPKDINGDGILDWDYPMDQQLGNGNKLVDLWGIDIAPAGSVIVNNGYPDCFVVVIGTDTNGNGKLEGDEITAVIGACTFAAGRNYGWVDKDTNVVHWVNLEFHKDSNGNLTNRVKQKRHYVYNPNTGKLKVYFDPDGDGPAPAYLEWPTNEPSGGDPNDYPWGVLGLGGDF